MPKLRMYKCLAALLLLCATPVQAAELRILDPMGLTRAVKFVENPVKVIVSATLEEDTAQPADVLLSHVDGLAPDIEGSRGANKSTTFADVPEGVWKIKAPDQRIIISEVKIVQ